MFLMPSNQKDQKKGSSQRGFAAMDAEQQREISAKGGRAAHQSGNAHEFDSEEAREAGRKGGQASHAASRGQSKGSNRRNEEEEDEMEDEGSSSSRGGGSSGRNR
jgi:general stress protein YciG